MMKSKLGGYTKMLSVVVLPCALLAGGVNVAVAEQEDSSKIEASAKVEPQGDEAALRKAGALGSEKEKQSYALGMNVGMQLRQKPMAVDTDPFIQGLGDAMSGGKTLLTVEESRKTVAEMQSDLKKRGRDLKSKGALENKEAGEKFLAENKTKEGVVTLESGLQYKVLKAGDGKKPAPDDTVDVHYRGTFVNGTEFDSSYKRNAPATFSVKKVIKGWRDALQLMPVGSKWQLVIPAELAYGERGAGRKIAPNATLVFEVELLAIKDKDSKQASTQEVSAAADSGATQAVAYQAAPALAAINVSFKLDPRLTKGLYMGERWVSPPTYTSSQDGKTMTVEARASGLDGKGLATTIRPMWTPADPEMVSVSPGQGGAVTITVKRAGETSLKIASQDVSKTLSIKATHARGSASEPLIVEISQ